jgi:hypothetical protein
MKLDILGICLLIAAFICLTLALQWGGTTYAWSNPRVWSCLLGFGLLISAFVADQIWMEDGYGSLVINGHKAYTLIEETERVFLCK